MLTAIFIETVHVIPLRLKPYQFDMKIYHENNIIQLVSESYPVFHAARMTGIHVCHMSPVTPESASAMFPAGDLVLDFGLSRKHIIHRIGFNL